MAAVPLIAAIVGGGLGGLAGAQENRKRKEEKAQLLADYRYLTGLYSPTRAQLLSAYMPRGEYSQRMAGLNREKANAMRYGGEAAARANAYRTGGIRSGAVDRGRRGSWLNLMAQGQTSADIGALSRLAAQDLATKGAQIQSYQYPGFGSKLEGVDDALITFAQAYEANRRG